MARGGKQRSRPSQAAVKRKLDENKSYSKNDVYETEDAEAEEDRLAGTRYDVVDNYEYEIPSDFEDEEIDEDEAFNSEDERMFGHMFETKRGEDNEAFDDSEEEDSDDVLLDSDSERSEGDGESSEDDGDEDERQFDALFHDDESGEEGTDQDPEQAEDDDAHDAMLKAVIGNEEVMPKGRGKHGHRILTEAFKESELNVPSTEGELLVEDLIAGLGTEGRSKLGAARKLLERLERRSAPVPAPLPGPIQARQERKAGYEAAKQEVSKWMPLVKANREAPTLRFTKDNAAVPRLASTAALAAKHVPETAMEAEVAALLASAGAQSAAALAESEEVLALKALTVEEAKQRREKLAKMRALLFYHELKSKRLKKIKSKEYRRRLKKGEKRKAQASTAEGGMLLDEDALRREIEEAEYERAKERLTLKHKNTSRFIRRALKRGGTAPLDQGTKDAVAEQLRLGDELRQRVHRMKGRNEQDSDSEASDDSDSDEANEGKDVVKGFSTRLQKAALEMLGKGSSSVVGQETDDVSAEKKGLLALPFMQRALERRREAAAREAREVLNGIGDANDQDDKETLSSGRLVFSGKAADTPQKKQVEALLQEVSDDDDDEREDVEAKAERLSRAVRRAKEVLPDNDQLPSAASVKKMRMDPQKELDTTGGSFSLQIDTENTNFIPATTFGGAKVGYVFKKGDRGPGYYADTTQMVTARPQSLEQNITREELVRRAFAGDDVVTEFAQAKAAEVESELPADDDMPGTLPGWGTWASTSKREPRWLLEAKAKAAAKRAAAAANRKDSSMEFVVISEKWDKKNSKYRTPSVPYPFDSNQTYERAMRQPLGRDFNTESSFRKLTRPSVIKDSGVIIQPIRFSSAMAEHVTDRQPVTKRPEVMVVAGGMPKRAKKRKT